jgi:hypothetical protein
LGSDPAVVAIDSGGSVACAGTLLAPDVVLTARHCVSFSDGGSECTQADRAPPPLRQAESLGVRVTDGSEFLAARVRGRDILVPPGAVGCGEDVALLLLEQPIDTVRAIGVRKDGIAIGGHVRSVGFAAEPDGGFRKRVRDHVVVVDTAATELLLHEAACTSGCGGPAIDEMTGQVVGVVSRGGPEGDVATRTDVFSSFVDGVLSQEGSSRVGAGAAREKKGPVDMGANCTTGADCAAGVCVTEAARRYCSRSCSAHDHCPAHFRCARSAQGAAICLAT